MFGLVISEEVPPVVISDYGYRRLVSVPPVAGFIETLSNFPFVFEATLNSFKQTADGGRLQNANAYDLIFSLLNGQQLDHWIANYDSVTGYLRCRLRIPQLSLSAGVLFQVFYGKSGVVSSPENINGVFLGAIAAVRADTGEDLTGKGRTFTPSGVTPTTIVGDPAGQYSTDDEAIADTTGYVNGLQAVSVEMLIDQDSAPLDARFIDTANNQFRLYASVTTGQGVDATYGFNINTTAGAVRARGASNIQTAGAAHLHAGWGTGQGNIIFVNGNADQLSFHENGTVAGVTSVGDALVIGAASEGGFTTVAGKIGVVTLWPFRPFEAWSKLSARNQLNPDETFGLGDEEDLSVPGDLSPVAVPLFRDTNTNTSITIDVLESAFIPEGQPDPTVTITDDGTLGTATLSGNDILYAPGSVGTDFIQYQIENLLGHVSAAAIEIEVVQGGGGGGGGGGVPFVSKYPSTWLPNILLSLYGDGRVYQVLDANPSNLQTVLNGVTGAVIVELANGTYSGNYNYATVATQNATLVIRPKNANGAVFTGDNNVTGRWIVITGLVFSGANASLDFSTTSQNCRVYRCTFRDQTTIGRGAILNLSGKYNHVDYNIFQDIRGWGLRTGTQDNMRHWIHHNYFLRFDSDRTNGTEALQIGTTRTFHRRPFEVVAEWNRFQDCLDGDDETISLKSSNNILYQNCGINIRGFENRGGMFNQWISNYIDGAPRGLYVCHTDGIAASNRLINCTKGLLVRGGTHDGSNEDLKGMARSERWKLSRNRCNRYEIGASTFSGSDTNAIDTRCELNVDQNGNALNGFGGAMVRGPLEANTQFFTTSSLNEPLGREVLVSEVGPSSLNAPVNGWD